MKILALELSSARGSIAFVEATAELFAAEFENDRKHSGAFFQQLRAAVDGCGAPDRIAVGLGPGSYAGTRIAIAAAIGLRAGTAAELTGIASVRTIATEATEYAVIGDARRASFYFACVQARRCLEGPLLCAEDELRARVLALDVPVFCTEPLPAIASAIVAFPSARVLARIAAQEEPLRSLAPLEPIYLRDPHITQPKPILAPKRR